MPTLVSASDERLLARITELSDQGASGVQGLLELFQHRSWTVRRAIVAVLAAGDLPSLETLANALVAQREHEPTIAGTVDALAASSSPLVEPILAALLVRPEPAVLCDAIQIAGRRRERSSVPRLIELTLHDDDNVALAAIEALGRMGGIEAVDRLLELAEGSNFFRAFPAIEVLGNSREARALPVLQRLLQKPIYATESARALGTIGSAFAVEALVRSLEQAPDSLVRVIAASLASIQEVSDKALEPAAAVSRAIRERSSPSLRAKVARALGVAQGVEAVQLGRLMIGLAEEESVSDFIPLLGANEELTRLAVEGLTQLGALADPRVVAALEAGSSELRSQLLPALRGVAAANSAIAACLSDPQPSVRALACHALSGGAATSAVTSLFGLLTDTDLGVVHAAVGAIQSLGSAETEALTLAAAASSNPTERRAGLRIVMYFGYPAAVQLARRALESDDERLRDVALAGLPTLEDPSVLELLLQTSRHPSVRTRASAIRALGHLGTEPVQAVLRSALDDPDAWVRYYACQALGRLQLASAVPALVLRLEDPAEQVKMAAVEALAAIPDAAARSALVDAARSSNREVQRAAIVGIGARQDASLLGELQRAISSLDAGVRIVALASLASFPGAEPTLEAAATMDADASVRSTALELLASKRHAEATLALTRMLQRDGAAQDVMTALLQNVDARVASILGVLANADDALARGLLTVLARAETRVTRAALDIAFESENVATRRATARVFGQIMDAGAKSSLARAASLDADLEVRRICSAAIA